MIVFRWNWFWIFMQNWLFFPQICLWKSHEIWPFFCDLSEALCYEWFMLFKFLIWSSFSLSPPPFFSITNTSNVQSWPIIFKKVNVRITLEAWNSGQNVRLSFWPHKSYFWPDIVHWPAVISIPNVSVPSWFYGSWALFWVPWVLQVHSTRLGPLQFLLEHNLGFTTIYSREMSAISTP